MRGEQKLSSSANRPIVPSVADVCRPKETVREKSIAGTSWTSRTFGR